MKVIVQFSGGKDSHAALILAVKKYGLKSIEAITMDTVWENPLLYLHIKDVVNQLGVKHTFLKSKTYPGGMLDLAEKKHRFPASKLRFCTEELKVKPFVDYLLDDVKDHVFIIQGIRAEESAKRANMNKDCTYFKYYFTPYTNNFLKLQSIEQTIHSLKLAGKKVPISKIKEKDTLINKLLKGDINNKFYTYRKREVKKYVKEFADDLHRPVFNLTGQEVIDIIINEGHQPFKMYSEGFDRVGCFPCVNENLFGIYQMAIRYPERIKELEAEEKRLGSTFFTTGKIPKRECANGQYPTITEVVAYVFKLYDQNKLFDDNSKVGCISHYNICAT